MGFRFSERSEPVFNMRREPIWLEKRAGCEHECRSRVGEISQPALSMNENTYFARK